MQADEVLRFYRGARKLGNGDGGSVRRKNAVGREFRLGLPGYCGLQLAVFEYRLDNQIAAFQIVRGIRGFDAAQDFCFLFFGHPATADFLGQQFLGVAFAFLGIFHGDVFQHHVDTACGRGIGNACAHHAGTQHTYLAEGFFFNAVGTAAACLDCVQLEPEGAGHVLGDLADHQFGKIPGFDQATVVEIHLGTFDCGGEDPLRRRIAASGFLLQHGRGDGQLLGHGGMVRRSARKPEAFLVPGLLAFGVCTDECPRLGNQVVGRICQLVNDAGLEGGFRIYLLALHQEREGGLQANHPGQSLGAATAGQQAQCHFRQAQLNAVVFNGHAVMAGQGDLKPAAQGAAVDGGNHRFAAGLEKAHVGFQAVDHVFKGLGILPGNLVELVQIAAGEEGLLG